MLNDDCHLYIKNTWIDLTDVFSLSKYCLEHFFMFQDLLPGQKVTSYSKKFWKKNNLEWLKVNIIFVILTINDTLSLNVFKSTYTLFRNKNMNIEDLCIHK